MKNSLEFLTYRPEKIPKYIHPAGSYGRVGTVLQICAQLAAKHGEINAQADLSEAWGLLCDLDALPNPHPWRGIINRIFREFKPSS